MVNQNQPVSIPIFRYLCNPHYNISVTQKANHGKPESNACLTHLHLVLSQDVVLHLHAGNLRQAVPGGVLAALSDAKRGLVCYRHVPYLPQAEAESGDQKNSVPGLLNPNRSKKLGSIKRKLPRLHSP